MKPTSLLVCLVFSMLLSAQNRYAIVMDEIMANPSPPIGLPNNEWIELKNVSATPVNLNGWRISDASGQSGPMPGFELQPDSFVIVCTGSAVAALSSFGKVIAVTSFPSLNNDGEILSLIAASGNIIHAVEYSSAWYNNDIKKDGGWSLEMIDTNNPCSGSNNWLPSHDAGGGTPGKKNSADAVNTDTEKPVLKNAFVSDSRTIHLVFNEPVDSLTATAISHYKIDHRISIINATPIAPTFNAIELKTDQPLYTDVYTISVNNIADCQGNTVHPDNKVKVALPADPSPGDLVINEILFNPPPDGYDYIELLNNSHKVLDASKIYIANRNSSGAISSASLISNSPFYIYPGDYVVATQDAANLHRRYLVKTPGQILTLSSLPSFPDAGGNVIIANIQGEIIDEVQYDKNWHFKLIDNDEGVALERINPGEPSRNASNWHSAASTAGYGTPTYKNSQYRQTETADAIVTISPKIFSPDNDGHDDIAVIQYKVSEPGYVSNITIFNATGRPVRVLVNNGTMGLTGNWNWDGLNDKGLKLPIGTYIIYTEIFTLQGRKKRFKNAVVLARRLN